MNVLGLTIVAVLWLMAPKSCLAAERCSLSLESELVRSLGSGNWSARSDALDKRATAFRELKKRCPTGEFDTDSRRRFFQYVREELRYQTWMRDNPTGTREISEGLSEAYRYYLDDLRSYLNRIVDPEKDLVHSKLILEFGEAETVAKLGRTVEDEVVGLLRGGPVASRPAGEAAIKAASALGFWIDAGSRVFSDQEKERLISFLADNLPTAEELEHLRSPFFSLRNNLAYAILASLGRSNSGAAKQAIQGWLERSERFIVTVGRVASDDQRIKAARNAVAAIEERLASRIDP